MIDYSKNWVLNQEMIRKGRVTIVGANALTNYLCFYMAGLGLRKIRIIDDSRCDDAGFEFLLGKERNPNYYKVESLEKVLGNINDDLIIESVPLALDRALIGFPDVLLDLSNNPRTKEICTKYFHDCKEIKLLVSASTSKTAGSAIFKRDKSKVSSVLSSDFLLEYACFEQGSFTSGVIAAMILDEIRKVISPLDGDYPLIGRINYGLSLENRLGFRKVMPYQNEAEEKDRVLVCGAGGIGTYVALNLALEGFDVDIADGDTIEDHNVARQIFYHNSVGRNKAFTLRDKLNELKIDSYVRACGEYLTKDNVEDMEIYEAIICCADNWEARRVLNEYAIETFTPLINCSVTPFSAHAESFIPSMNSCLECRYDFDSLVNNARRGCAELQESNVVMPNAFIGAFVVGEVKEFLKSEKTVLENNFDYQSKKGNKRKFNIVKKYRGNERCKCHM